MRKREPERGEVELFENVINTFLENKELSEMYFCMGEMIVQYKRSGRSSVSAVGFNMESERDEDGETDLTNKKYRGEVKEW